MTDNYAKIVRSNLTQLYADLPPNLASCLPAEQEGMTFHFKAFAQSCRITPQGIFFGEKLKEDVFGILLSLYALRAKDLDLILEPFIGFKEVPDSMPYVGAFATHTEQILIPMVNKIGTARDTIISAFDGQDVSTSSPGDFAFILKPLPKIALQFIFYEADEDFPAAVTCLFSHNAAAFMPVDGLADVGEYTSRRMLEMIG
ncbi:MAG: DUF3786 domain-containing protein [Desulfobacteraceae bacterium]|jgi:hypothetical protein